MNWLINLAAKVTGINALAKKLDGFNTKGAAVAGILTGAAGIITQFVAIPHDPASLLHFVQAIPTDPSWLMLVASWAALGIGRKMEKAAGVDPEAPVAK